MGQARFQGEQARKPGISPRHVTIGQAPEIMWQWTEADLGFRANESRKCKSAQCTDHHQILLAKQCTAHCSRFYGF